MQQYSRAVRPIIISNYKYITVPKSAQCTLKWALRWAAEFQEFAAVSHGIWQTAPQNLAKFAAENYGPYIYVTHSIVCLLYDSWDYCNDACTKLCRWPNNETCHLLKVFLMLSRDIFAKFVQQLTFQLPQSVLWISRRQRNLVLFNWCSFWSEFWL